MGPFAIFIKGELTSFNFYLGRVGRFKSFSKVIERNPRIHVLSAGKQIKGCESILGPCVNGQMGFCYDHHTADAMWGKLMEGVPADGGAASFGGLYHGTLNGIPVVQNLWVTIINLNQDMPS
jgi:hypothetical protein